MQIPASLQTRSMFEKLTSLAVRCKGVLGTDKKHVLQVTGVSGNMSVSKTEVLGSIPEWPAKLIRKQILKLFVGECFTESSELECIGNVLHEFYFEVAQLDQSTWLRTRRS